MKKQIIIMALAASVLPAIAQTTNSVPEKPAKKDRPEQKGDYQGKRGDGWNRGERERREMTEEEKAQRQERRLQLMEKTLTDIGVTDEQRQQIKDMQAAFREEMKAASEKVNAARDQLHKLESSGASQEEIFAAIDAVSTAQSEQLKVLAKNRMAMEKLLGPEKFKQFMEAARTQYKKHGGRRGGAGRPPIPGEPPIP